MGEHRIRRNPIEASAELGIAHDVHHHERADDNDVDEHGQLDGHLPARLAKHGASVPSGARVQRRDHTLTEDRASRLIRAPTGARTLTKDRVSLGTPMSPHDEPAPRRAPTSIVSGTVISVPGIGSSAIA